MKILLTICLISLASLTKADEMRMHTHHKLTVKFVFHGITVYTDTSSLFHVLPDDIDISINGRHAIQSTKDLVLRRLQQSKNDTATFTGDFFPFNDSIPHYLNWYPETELTKLLKERRGTFIDAKGVLVKHFITHKEGSKAKGRIDRIYMNRANHERLFSESIYWEILFGGPRY